MKKNVVPVMVVAAMIVAAGCSYQKKDNAQDVKTESQGTVQNEKDDNSIFGSYTGTFPCADCGGKDVDITINEDGTYCLKYQYQDKDEGLIEENGTYSILDGKLVVTVTPSSGVKTYYKFTDGNLVLTDSLGTDNEGELAEFYVLKRKKN